MQLPVSAVLCFALLQAVPGNSGKAADCDSLKKGISFISYCQWWKEGMFYASELAGIEPTPPA
jgi:hypothetical protein